MTAFVFLLSIGAIAMTSLRRPGSDAKDQTLTQIHQAFQAFASSTENLYDAVARLDSNNNQTLVQAKDALKRCRLRYKAIEYFLEYFFHSSALIYNGPAKYEVEEPFMEFEAPRGFQQIELILFSKDAFLNHQPLLSEVQAIRESARGLDGLLYNFSMTDAQLLESVRIELIRVITLSVSGYDAPKLKSGIDESLEALHAIQARLEPWLQIASKESDSTRYFLQCAISLLQTNRNFDSFDRLGFFTMAALPLQKHFGLLIKERHAELKTARHLNYGADNIFSKDAIVMQADGRDERTPDSTLVRLGKILFSETALSGNYSRSCKTCHNPGLYFTDGLQKSIAYDNHSFVKRNAPSLLYAAYQYCQFWDGRAVSLEEQVQDVLTNPEEMNANLLVTERRLQKSDRYKALFRRAFSNEEHDITIQNATKALAAFIRTLAPTDAPFDQYLAGNRSALTSQQKQGFNLFMGKAQCGTCHFAPFFNGLRPPFYDITEFEVLGIPVNDSFERMDEDNDPGRYSIIPIPYYKQAFKTPTVRNCAGTAPYMHNGSLHSLEKVLDFYNKGGGNGMGLKTQQQTLAPEKLGLSASEMSQIIAFLNALTDQPQR